MPNFPFQISSILNGASNNVFSNSTFVVQSDRISAFDRLEKAATPSAFHSYVGRPQPGKVYPNTRVSLLDILKVWTLGMQLPPEAFNAGLRRDSGVEEPHQLRNLPIMWLNGAAGAGKSAVAQTFAEQCEDLGHTMASFFFFSTDSTRNTANCLVATLAYQIALCDPGARASMEEVIHKDPHIFNKDLKLQFSALIVSPVQKSTQAQSRNGSRDPCVIIIDGLDECTGAETQVGIVQAICGSLAEAGSSAPGSNTRLPHFLICSRPEDPIARAFSSRTLKEMCTPINLSSNSDSWSDIRVFLVAKFDEIKETHPRSRLIPSSWPSTNDIDTLTVNSSGHFIYPETVLKFISSHSRPVVALDGILGLRALPQQVRDPLAELDVLYEHILSRALRVSSLDTIRLVFGFLSIKDSPASLCHPDVLEEFLNLADGELDTLFSIVSSLVSISRWDDTMKAHIQFCHKSFEDYLRNDLRNHQFYMNEGDICGRLMDRCHAILVGTPTAKLTKEMLDLIKRIALGNVKEYDVADGKRQYCVRGMAQRCKLAPLVRTYDQFDTWVARCAIYYSFLLQNLNREVDTDKDELAHEATGYMISILQELKNIADMAADLALCMSQPSRRNVRNRWRDWPLNRGSEAIYGLDGFLFDLTKVCTDGPDSAQRAHHFTAMMRCFKDPRMGEHRLDGKGFAEACVTQMTRVTKTYFFCPSQHVVIRQNQHNMIMNNASRRRYAPFLWRKTRRILRPSRSKGRSKFLACLSVFVGRFKLELYKALTNRELVFGARCTHPQLSRSEPRKLVLRGWTSKLQCHLSTRLFADFNFRAKKSWPKASDMWLVPTWMGSYQEDIYFDDSPGGTKIQEHERYRRDMFGIILARIPSMLARASKSDAVAALRFQAFPPLALRFPKLARRARRAMEEYAVRHGYQKMHGQFGPPFKQERRAAAKKKGGCCRFLGLFLRYIVIFLLLRWLARTYTLSGVEVTGTSGNRMKGKEVVDRHHVLKV